MELVMMNLTQKTAHMMEETAVWTISMLIFVKSAYAKRVTSLQKCTQLQNVIFF